MASAVGSRAIQFVGVTLVLFLVDLSVVRGHRDDLDEGSGNSDEADGAVGEELKKFMGIVREG